MTIFYVNPEQKPDLFRLMSEGLVERRRCMIFLSVSEDKTWDVKDKLDSELNRLMDLYGDDVLRTCYMFLKDRHRAEDAFQEVFLKVYRSLNGFKAKSSEKTWIISIAINHCKDMLRSSWVKRVMLTDRIRSASAAPDVEKGLIRQDEKRFLYETVLALPQVLKEVIILYYYQELDTREIAHILKIPEGTVRSRLHKARTVLRKELGGGWTIN
jgi:RNA polymerase sigma-70 factor (ECF subfamily)